MYKPNGVESKETSNKLIANSNFKNSNKNFISKILMTEKEKSARIAS